MNSMKPRRVTLITRAASLLICLSVFLGACTSLALPGPDNSTWLPLEEQPPTPTPFQPISLAGPTAVAPLAPNPLASPTPAPLLPPTPTSSSTLALWADPRLPEAARHALALPPLLEPVENPEIPERQVLRLEPGGDRPVSRWVYALVAPFPTLSQGVSLDELQRAWRGEETGQFAGRPLWMDESTQAMLASLWGPAAPQAVALRPAAELLDAAWGEAPSWAVVPFESLDPRWTVLEVEGQTPLAKDFDPAVYPLTVPISLVGQPDLADALLAVYGAGSAQPLLPASNRDSQRLTVLAMTGVTALVRATAYTMEQRGLLYPAKDVGDLLRGADLTHISNEVPFAEDCPPPNPVQADMRFCSDPRYIALMEDVGTDIVELTGDHFADWGTAAMRYTLELYQARGWQYYGGGANLEEGRRAITREDHGNRLAFIGCNAKGAAFAKAGPDNPGAVTCDFDWMTAEIARLRGEGYLPIATFQHFEYYTYAAKPDQERDFRRLAEAGAVIVSGSQAHQPQSLEFDGETLIHYGLGNLFFDQYDVSQATRQGFIDLHIFYAGRYISTRLVPIVFVDYARPRFMTPEEREDLLRVVFGASGW